MTDDIETTSILVAVIVLMILAVISMVPDSEEDSE